MPNTKSAIKRTRSSERKHVQNSAAKSRLRTLEKNFRKLAESGSKEKAAEALGTVTSALDKAAKAGTIHWRTVSRKKSRLASCLNRAGAAA